MLVLLRHPNESFRIRTSDGPITVTVVDVVGARVHVGIDAPQSCQVLRSELAPPPSTSVGGESIGKHRAGSA